MSTILTISSSDLSSITGGAGQSFNDFTNSERSRISDQYRSVVCTTAGIKGGPDLATGVYGQGASDADKIRAAGMINQYCQGGATLPAAAPKAPF